MSDRATNRLRAQGYDIPTEVPPTRAQLYQRLAERDAVIADLRERLEDRDVLVRQLKAEVGELVEANGNLSSALVQAERVNGIAGLIEAANRQAV